jgi:hypothetical protein
MICTIILPYVTFLLIDIHILLTVFSFRTYCDGDSFPIRCDMDRLFLCIRIRVRDAYGKENSSR